MPWACSSSRARGERHPDELIHQYSKFLESVQEYARYFGVQYGLHQERELRAVTWAGVKQLFPDADDAMLADVVDIAIEGWRGLKLSTGGSAPSVR